LGSCAISSRGTFDSPLAEMARMRGAHDGEGGRVGLVHAVVHPVGGAQRFHHRRQSLATTRTSGCPASVAEEGGVIGRSPVSVRCKEAVVAQSRGCRQQGRSGSSTLVRSRCHRWVHVRMGSTLPSKRRASPAIEVGLSKVASR